MHPGALAPRLDDEVGPLPEERVPCEPLAALDAFQQNPNVPASRSARNAATGVSKSAERRAHTGTASCRPRPLAAGRCSATRARKVSNVKGRGIKKARCKAVGSRSEAGRRQACRARAPTVGTGCHQVQARGASIVMRPNYSRRRSEATRPLAEDDARAGSGARGLWRHGSRRCVLGGAPEAACRTQGKHTQHREMGIDRGPWKCALSGRRVFWQENLDDDVVHGLSSAVPHCAGESIGADLFCMRSPCCRPSFTVCGPPAAAIGALFAMGRANVPIRLSAPLGATR